MTSVRYTLLLFVAALLAFANVALAGQKKVCQSYAVSNPSDAAGTPLVQSSVQVDDEFMVDHVKVNLDLLHRRIGALVVKLQSKYGDNDAKEVILKERGLGGLGDNMMTTFDDKALRNFPNKKENAPFQGSFRPSESTTKLLEGDGTMASEGGSKGAWTLVIEDTAPNSEKRIIVLNNWSLDLCGYQEVADQETPSSPSPSPSPAATPSPSSPAPPVTGFSGPAQERPVEYVAYSPDYLTETPVELGLFGYGFPLGQQAAQWLKQYGSRYEAFLNGWLDPKNYPQKELLYKALIWDLYISQGSRVKIAALEKTIDGIKSVFDLLDIDEEPEKLLDGLNDWKAVIEKSLEKYEDIKKGVYDYKVENTDKVGDFIKNLLD